MAHRIFSYSEGQVRDILHSLSTAGDIAAVPDLEERIRSLPHPIIDYRKNHLWSRDFLATYEARNNRRRQAVKLLLGIPTFEDRREAAKSETWEDKYAVIMRRIRSDLLALSELLDGQNSEIAGLLNSTRRSFTNERPYARMVFRRAAKLWEDCGGTVNQSALFIGYCGAVLAPVARTEKAVEIVGPINTTAVWVERQVRDWWAEHGRAAKRGPKPTSSKQPPRRKP